MSEVIYDSESEALDIAAQRLAEVSDLPVDVLRVFTEKATVVEEETEDPSKGLPRQLHPALVGRFAIRNDELLNIQTFLSLVKNATKLAAGISGYATLAGVTAIADALYGFYTFYKEIIAKGFLLSNDQLEVIASLRELRAATTAEIAERLQKHLPDASVDEILASFSRARQPERGFVSRDESGRWIIKGL